MRRAYKFRAYPTQPQEGRAVQLLADHCDLYNAALEERREAWSKRKASISYGAQSAQLKEIRADDRYGQGRHSAAAQQQTLRRLNVVFQAFYDRCAAGQQPGHRSRRVILVNPAGTSITCHLCTARCIRPRQDTVICPVHGPIDADVNGARNIVPGPGWALVRPPKRPEKLPSF